MNAMNTVDSKGYLHHSPHNNLEDRRAFMWKMVYDLLQELLSVAEDRSGLTLMDAVGDPEKASQDVPEEQLPSTTYFGSSRYWHAMYNHTLETARTRAADAGFDINILLGREIA